MMSRFLALLFLLCIACTPPASTEESSGAEDVATEAETPVEENEDTEDEAGPMVYVTNDGDKYHTADCRYSKTAHEVKLNQAKADGKTACGVCNPNSKTGEKQERCSSNTADGKRCQRMTSDKSGKCFQHRESSTSSD